MRCYGAPARMIQTKISEFFACYLVGRPLPEPHSRGRRCHSRRWNSMRSQFREIMTSIGMRRPAPRASCLQNREGDEAGAGGTMTRQ